MPASAEETIILALVNESLNKMDVKGIHDRASARVEASQDQNFWYRHAVEDEVSTYMRNSFAGSALLRRVNLASLFKVGVDFHFDVMIDVKKSFIIDAMEEAQMPLQEDELHVCETRLGIVVFGVPPGTNVDAVNEDNLPPGVAVINMRAIRDSRVARRTMNNNNNSSGNNGGNGPDTFAPAA